MTSFPIALFLLLAAGIQYAVGGDNIFAPLRAPLPAIVRSLLECTACCGFWIGVGLQGVGLDIWPPAQITGAAAVVIKCAGSGLAAAVGVPLVRYFGPDGSGRT